MTNINWSLMTKGLKTLQKGLWWIVCCCSMSSIAAIYCPASINTVVNARKCPRTSFEWKNASVSKNCTNEIQSCVRQTDFVYHCVLNTYLNATVEVCAPSTNILGHTCAEYNMEGARIQGHVDTVCTSCPFRYPSTDAYKFQSCYSLIKRVELTTTTEKILSTLPSLHNTTLPSLQNSTFTMKPVKSNVYIVIITIIVLVAIAAVICVVSYFYRRLKYQRTLIDKENRSSEWSPLTSGENETNRKFTVALEIGQHFSGYGYSTKRDNTPRIPVDSSGKAKKIPSAVWYSKTKEVKIGYDALDEYIKCDGNPPEGVSYSSDLVFDYIQEESCMQHYSRFLLGLLNAVLQFIGNEQKSQNKAKINIVLILKKCGVTEEISKSMKEYVLSGITEAGVSENQIKFLTESECVCRYVQPQNFTSADFCGESSTIFSSGGKDKIMILKTGHAGIQYDIFEINKEEEECIAKHHIERNIGEKECITKHVYEHFSVWSYKKLEDKFWDMLPDQFKNISLRDLKRDFKAFCIELSLNLHKLKENPGEIKHVDIGLPEKLRTALHPKSGSVPPAKGILISENKLTIGSEAIQGFMEDICRNTKTILYDTCTEDRLKEVSFVCLIGGYAYNERIQTIVREHFRRISNMIHVHVPEQPDFVAVKGAMLDTL